jgi:hypothetical protein
VAVSAPARTRVEHMRKLGVFMLEILWGRSSAA